MATDFDSVQITDYDEHTSDGNLKLPFGAELNSMMNEAAEPTAVDAQVAPWLEDDLDFDPPQPGPSRGLLSGKRSNASLLSLGTYAGSTYSDITFQDFGAMNERNANYPIPNAQPTHKRSFLGNFSFKNLKSGAPSGRGNDAIALPSTPSQSFSPYPVRPSSPNRKPHRRKHTKISKRSNVPPPLPPKDHEHATIDMNFDDIHSYINPNGHMSSNDSVDLERRASVVLDIRRDSTMSDLGHGESVWTASPPDHPAVSSASYIHTISSTPQTSMFVNPFADSRTNMPFGSPSGSSSGGSRRPTIQRKISASSTTAPSSQLPHNQHLTSLISALAIPEPPTAHSLSSNPPPQPSPAPGQEGTSPTWLPPESWGVALPRSLQSNDAGEDTSESEHEADGPNAPFTTRSPARNSSIISNGFGHGSLNGLKSDSLSAATAAAIPPRSRNHRESLPMLYGGTPNSQRLSFSARSTTAVPPQPAVYRLRIYGPNGSFHTFEVNLTQTAAELQVLWARKALVQRDACRLYIRELGTERMLAQTERPAGILKRRLEQLGYDQVDNGEKMGSEEIGFFLKFIFKSPISTETPRRKTRIREHDQYEFIDLSGQQMVYVPITLHKLAERIVRLDVSRSPMLDLPKDFIDACVQLRELILAGSSYKRIPVNVRYGAKLSWVDLSSNRIHKLDDSALDFLTELRTLRLQNNRIETLPAYFGRLNELRYLNISNNKFDRLPDVVADIKSLVDLDISFNVITVFPAQILQLPLIERLIVVGNQLASFPPDCSSLNKLTFLDCRRNVLTDLTPVCRLPQLNTLLAEGNQVLALDLTLGPSLHTLEVSKNDITRLVLMQGPQEVATAYSLISLDVSSAKLSALDDAVLGQLTSLTHLKLDNNQFRSVPSTLGKLTKLVSLSFTENQVDVLPDSIGDLHRLETLNVRNNNLSEIPAAIWQCENLKWLNATSNVIHTFADPAGNGKRSESDPVPPLALSLQNLYLADNHLTDEVYYSLTLFRQLRVLNLSSNEITSLSHWTQSFDTVVELYLSGNKITALPDDMHDRFRRLAVLYLNGNKLQSIPADLNKISNLSVLDVGSNQLKYNINNWQFEWNWNYNTELRYLNLSGNRRLEIKPDHANTGKPLPEALVKATRMQDLSQFIGLTRLRVLGLMDVNTAFMPPVPDEHEDFRVRTSFSEINGMAYGIADTLGNGDHITMFDLVVPNFRSRDNECLFGMFGRSHAARSSSRLTKFLQENFTSTFTATLKDIKTDKNERTPDALRRAFLTLNKSLYEFLAPVAPLQPMEQQVPLLVPGRKASRVSAIDEKDKEDMTGTSDYRSGASAIVVYVVEKTLYVANVGHALAVVSRNGVAQPLSMRHDPLDRNETMRIRKAEAWVSPKGTVNDEADTSRSFGLFHLLPAVNSRPTVRTWELQEFDDILIIANRGLWEYMSMQRAVDVARTMEDPMLASQKLRDLAMSYGADGSTMVMVLKVGDLVGNKGKAPARPLVDMKRRNAGPDQAILKYLGDEVPPPTGSVALVFTDIQNSTRLWDLNAGMPTAMRLHNNLLRRLLRTNRGYEVKTEGDAFVVSFQDVLQAVHFCLEVQVRLLQEEWPLEILESEDGKEARDTDGTIILRGVSVRMGIHRGNPVCEPDPVTKRMDYFGGVMNRAARISGFAQGGQISLSAEVASEIRRTILDGEVEVESDMAATVDSIKRIGVFIKEVGEKKLKGLEVPEVLSIMYPAQLKARLELHEQRAAGSYSKPADSRVQFSITQVQQLSMLCARLETLSSSRVLRAPGDLREGERNDDGRILYADPSLFMPALKDSPSDSDMMIVLDSLSVRVQNALESLDHRPTTIVGEVHSSLDDLLALIRQRSPDEQMALAAALGLQPAAV
ncbi:L domain-like protein [Auriculariales sp. MPI-PUGE-AT-0066]|nr:L domain-like protein [Auriculariales sp. MPI-PUGE-AT-0066]